MIRKSLVVSYLYLVTIFAANAQSPQYQITYPIEVLDAGAYRNYATITYTSGYATTTQPFYYRGPVGFTFAWHNDWYEGNWNHSEACLIYNSGILVGVLGDYQDHRPEGMDASESFVLTGGNYQIIIVATHTGDGHWGNTYWEPVWDHSSTYSISQSAQPQITQCLTPLFSDPSTGQILFSASVYDPDSGLCGAGFEGISSSNPNVSYATPALAWSGNSGTIALSSTFPKPSADTIIHANDFVVTDNFGYVVRGGTTDLVFDGTPPTISLASEPVTFSGGEVYLQVSASDGLSGLKSIGVGLADNSKPGITKSYLTSVGPATKTDSFKITSFITSSNSAISFTITAKDNANNSSALSYVLDNTPPHIANGPIASLSGDGTSLNFAWTITSNGSGISNCSLSYKVASTDAATSVSQYITSNGSQYSATVPISTRLYGTTPTFFLIATDMMGNQCQASVAITIPPQISMTASVFPLNGSGSEAEQSGQIYMEVDLDFGISPQALRGFTSLVVNRSQATSGVSTVSLPNLTIDPSTIPSSVNASSASPATTPWKLNGNGNAIYADYIPVSSGAGHKSWTYTLSAYCGGSSTPWGGVKNPTGAVSLPNNQGSLIAFNVLDMNGNLPTSPDFTVGADGAVQIEFQGNDPDQDSWNFEIDRVNQRTEPTSTGGTYTFTSYTPLNGSAQKYPYSSGGYADKLVPVTLSYGDNNIQLSWMEGADITVVHSEVKDLEVKRGNGIYSLTVHDGYGNEIPDTMAGLTSKPGQPLVFTVSASDQSNTAGIQWDFGDGSGIASGSNQTHSYHQDPNQVTCSITRTLTLTLPTIPLTDIPISVTVQDTQEGMLYEPEHWNGDHTVTGVVVVPQDSYLHILPNATVSFQGDLGAGYGQGILVNGTLTIDGGVTLQALAGQSQGWGTILVEGNAIVNADGGSKVTIRDAERGIAADSTAKVQLTNTTLANNLTGIQVLKNATVTMTGCNITENTVYGVKEEEGGRPTVTGTMIKDNLRNYYQWDGGLININQINALGNNTGNQGE